MKPEELLSSLGIKIAYLRNRFDHFLLGYWCPKEGILKEITIKAKSEIELTIKLKEIFK